MARTVSGVDTGRAGGQPPPRGEEIAGGAGLGTVRAQMPGVAQRGGVLGPRQRAGPPSPAQPGV